MQTNKKNKQQQQDQKCQRNIIATNYNETKNPEISSLYHLGNNTLPYHHPLPLLKDLVVHCCIRKE